MTWTYRTSSRTVPDAPPPDRRTDLATRLARVRTRIADACAAAGRDRAEVTLVAVTKTYPASDVLHLAGLGVRDIGENRDQEAAPKAAEVAAAGSEVRWHFVGQLQRNKARSVVGYASLVHSVDGVRLATALGRAAARYREQPLDVLVQVSLDGDPARGGAVPEGLADPPPDRQLAAVAEAVAGTPALRLRGVMAVPPLDWAPERAFERLAAVASTLRDKYPTAQLISAGMSADLEQAVAFGATHVRIGSALLGNRPPLR
ncbi:MAG: YggS family pyridoxal phosphate-dependent enzyme [Actinobacteria bacterium]|nr:MAG: YggS family pyridoxal phosphate-dependent enzyme [Actinomycetota bacterium]